MKGQVHLGLPLAVSIGIIARNEEDSIGMTLESLLGQSLFQHLVNLGISCQIIVVANACTDETVTIAKSVLESSSRSPVLAKVTTRILELEQPGKVNAWNVFVHEESFAEAKYLILMDADITFVHADVLWNMVGLLESKRSVSVATSQPVKDIVYRKHRSVADMISLATSKMTQAGAAQLSGQLYCIRADIARRIYLPQGVVGEDGIIKKLVCTNFMTGQEVDGRVVRASGAAHVFEAYTGIGIVLRNQKRQMIAQVVNHVLLDQYLGSQSFSSSGEVSRLLRRNDNCDPQWLERLVVEHVRRCRYFWQLFPGAILSRFRRLQQLPRTYRATHLPSALVGVVVTALACWMANKAIRKGEIFYWPDTNSQRLASIWKVNDNG